MLKYEIRITACVVAAHSHTCEKCTGASFLSIVSCLTPLVIVTSVCSVLSLIGYDSSFSGRESSVTLSDSTADLNNHHEKSHSCYQVNRNNYV